MVLDLDVPIIYTCLTKRRRCAVPEVEIGTVSDFFSRPVVAGIELKAPLKIGDTIHIHGHTTDITMTVQSMQINNVNVEEAKAGDAVGVKLPDRARRGDAVFKVTE
jgi:translation elongation factor EF-Tu-like GTPase